MAGVCAWYVVWLVRCVVCVVWCVVCGVWCVVCGVTDKDFWEVSEVLTCHTTHNTHTPTNFLWSIETLSKDMSYCVSKDMSYCVSFDKKYVILRLFWYTTKDMSYCVSFDTPQKTCHIASLLTRHKPLPLRHYQKTCHIVLTTQNTIYCAMGWLWSVGLINCRSLLQKSRIKETIFFKIDL